VGRYERKPTSAGRRGFRRVEARRIRAAGPGRRSVGEVSFSGRLGAVAFLAGGVVAVVFALTPEGWPIRRISVGVSLGVILVGLVGLTLPWERWDPRAQLLYPVAGFALVAYAAHDASGGTAAYVAAFTLLFVLVGFSQRLGICIALLPVALGVLRIGAGMSWDMATLIDVTFELVVGVVAGEAIAFVLRRQRRAETHIEHLLSAVRVIVRITAEREGVEVLASLAADLVDADAAVVYLADPRVPHRFLCRGWNGHPALANSAPMILDASRVHSDGVQVFADVRAAGLVDDPKIANARTAALVPLPDDDALLGAVVLLWGTPRRGLPRSARYAAELLSEEAGRMFGRLRTAAALVVEAETDPLTCLANRRTFARALTTLRPGDAVVVVDLDHFKSVNDTYGHAAGDETLRRLAGCLRSVSRQADCVARYGGEEFALVLAEAGSDGARVVMQRLRRAWAREQAATTFSAGVAVHAPPEPPADTLHRADLALYRAKESGRDRIEFADLEIILS